MLFKKPEEIRKDLGLSQKEFAKQIGMPLRRYAERIKDNPIDWKLNEVVEVAKLNKGEVSINNINVKIED